MVDFQVLLARALGHAAFEQFLTGKLCLATVLMGERLLFEQASCLQVFLRALSRVSQSSSFQSALWSFLYGLALHLLSFSGTLELCHDFLVCLLEVCFVLLDSVHFGPHCFYVELLHEIFFLDSFRVASAYERALALMLAAVRLGILCLDIEIVCHTTPVCGHEFI